MVGEFIEAELAQRIGAEHGERAPERRATQRNGYRYRDWDTRVGTIELAIPKLRRGSFMPSILEPRRRAEQALVAVVQEAYVNGVSTRKVDRLVEQLGLHGMSKDQVSRLCRCARPGSPDTWLVNAVIMPWRPDGACRGLGRACGSRGVRVASARGSRGRTRGCGRGAGRGCRSARSRAPAP